MKTITKKIQPQYFEAILAGKKKYELRLNDFDVAEGDILLLQEWDPEAKEFTGRSIEKKVSHVLQFKIDDLFWPEEEIKKHGLQIISLE